MRRVTLHLVFTLILSLVTASARTHSRQPEAEAIDIARTIALATERLVGMRRTSEARDMGAATREALRRLKQLGQPAVEELRKALHMKENYVAASSAAYALYLLDPSQVDMAVEALMMQIDSAMFTNDMLAQRLVLAIGPPAVPTLIRHLNDSMIVQLLGAMGSEARSAVPALKEVLGTKNVEVATTLAAIRTSEAIEVALPVLIDALKNPHNPYAATAVIALGKLGAQARVAIPVVRKALSSINSDIRLYAAIALADMGDTAYAVGALSNLIQNKELHGRYAAIQKLSSLGLKAIGAIPALAILVSDSNDKQYGDRAMAAIALTKISPNSPVTKLALQKTFSETQLRLQMEKQGLRIRQ